MRLRILLACILLIAIAAAGVWWRSERVADRLLDEARQGDPSGLGCQAEAEELGIPDPFPRFVREMNAARSFDDLSESLSRATRLPRSVAKPVAKAFLREVAVGEKGLLAHFDELAADWQEAVDNSPRFSVLALAGGFFDTARRLEARTPNEGRAERRFREVVRTFPLKSAENVRRFLLLVRTIPGLDITVDALKMRGAEHPVLFCSLGSRHKPHDARQALLMEKNLSFALAHPNDCDPQTVQHLVGRALDSLVSSGLWRHAAAAYHSLPASLRDQALSAQAIPDVRLGLAAALLLAGDASAAHQVMDRYTTPRMEDARGRDEFADELQANAAREILLLASSPANKDPFGALIPALWDRNAPNYAFRLVEARVARERYPDVARHLLEKIGSSLDHQDVLKLTDQQRALYEFLQIDLKAADAEIHQAQDTVHSEVAETASDSHHRRGERSTRGDHATASPNTSDVRVEAIITPAGRCPTVGGDHGAGRVLDSSSGEDGRPDPRGRPEPSIRDGDRHLLVAAFKRRREAMVTARLSEPDGSRTLSTVAGGESAVTGRWKCSTCGQTRPKGWGRRVG